MNNENYVAPSRRALDVKDKRSDRECGSCQLCCELSLVLPAGFREEQRPTDLDLSLPGSKCKQQCRDGCAIYGDETRPKQCIEFECLWLKHSAIEGLMTAKHRPDRCGVILTDTPQHGVIIAMADSDETGNRRVALELKNRLMQMGFRVIPALGGKHMVIVPTKALKKSATKMGDEDMAQFDPPPTPLTETN